MSPKTKDNLIMLGKVILFIAGIYLLYKIFSSLFGGANPNQAVHKDELRKLRARLKVLNHGMSGDVASVSTVPGTQTYPDTQFSVWADTLQGAMVGGNIPGMTEPNVISVFGKVNNEADVLALTLAFGERTSTAGLNNKPQMLGEWLSGDGQVVTVNQLLRDHSVNFQF